MRVPVNSGPRQASDKIFGALSEKVVNPQGPGDDYPEPRRPVGAENLCHQAIFMNHASGMVTPEDAEVVQVGDAFGQRAERRGLVQGTVRPVGVVEVLVLTQDGHQVALVPDQGPVQQLAPTAADPAFHDESSFAAPGQRNGRPWRQRTGRRRRTRR